MITRLLHPSLLESPKSILLLGPRQVGKSTLLESLEPELTINLADQSEYLSFTSNPNELKTRLELTKPKTVLIDEIQRLPDLLNTIQVLLDDRKRKLKFYLSGSSARKLRKGSANLLPGRVFQYRLGPLSCLELGGKMDSLKALSVGCMPEPYSLSSHKLATKLLSSYTGTYLQEEIMMEAAVRQIQGFSRFLTIVAANSGGWLDFSKLAQKAKVDRNAARRFYELLEDTLICDRLDSYSEEGALDLVKHPKFYLFDLGIVNAVLDNFKPSQDRIGHLFEHLFYNQLKNSSFALDKKIDISHFRSRGGLEVDFVVRIDDRLILIEVKASEPSPQELKTLKLINQYIKSKTTEKYVACLNVKAKKVGDVSILPWQDVIQAIFK